MGRASPQVPLFGYQPFWGEKSKRTQVILYSLLPAKSAYRVEGKEGWVIREHEHVL